MSNYQKLRSEKDFNAFVDHLVIDDSKLNLIKRENEPFGIREIYRVDKFDMPENGLACVMHQENYSTNPKKVRPQEDGSGIVGLYFSIGD